jgi:hypothetical protein
MGAGVTIVCQINNVFLSGGVKEVMKQAGLIEGAVAAAAEDDGDGDNPSSTTGKHMSNKKKRKDKSRKEE